MDKPTTLPLANTRAYGPFQRTVRSAIDCIGIGVHSGRQARLAIRPAPAGHGIVFRRTDLNRRIPARYDTVCDTRLCTVAADPAMPSARVGTIEHVMAALWAMGIDNALIDVDGPEVPILDGSAAPYVFLLDCAGQVEQAAMRRVIKIRETVRVNDGKAWAELSPLQPLEPSAAPLLEAAVTIDFPDTAIGRQSCSVRLEPAGFRYRIAGARTFALAQDVERLREAGFAQGGSLDNAIVVDGDTVLNPGGLRMGNEFARHKLLDSIGDLALAGARIHGRFTANRPGHALNNRLLRALFSSRTAWRDLEPELLPAAA